MGLATQWTCSVNADIPGSKVNLLSLISLLGGMAESNLKKEYDSGCCHAQIQKEYLRPKPQTESKSENADSSADVDPEEPPHKRQKGVSRGRVRRDKLVYRIDLCPNVGRGVKECPFAKCKYSHDVEQYLASKPADAGPRCHLFDKMGHCPFGYLCRFARAHIDSNGQLISNKEKGAPTESQSVTMYTLSPSRSPQKLLGKHSSLVHALLVDLQQSVPGETNLITPQKAKALSKIKEKNFRSLPISKIMFVPLLMRWQCHLCVPTAKW